MCKLWSDLPMLAAVAASVLLGTACSARISPESPVQKTMTNREINAVLDEHDEKLMAIPGVVGVYVGLMDDEKTTCLKVMVVKRTAELERKIPKLLEGFPVVLHETGVIRPLEK